MEGWLLLLARNISILLSCILKRKENRNERIQHQVQLIQTWFFINAKYNKKKLWSKYSNTEVSKFANEILAESLAKTFLNENIT